MTNQLTAGQQTAARIAGSIYLLTTVTANFAEFYVGRLVAPADAAETGRRIAASQRLFRLGAVSDLITFAAAIALVVALYVVLSPVNRNLAVLAAFWRLAEASIFAVITLNDFVAVRLLSGTGYLRAFNVQQLQALAQLFIGVHADGYLIGLVFFGLGSSVFACLWFISRYIPRVLASLGVVSSLAVVFVTLAIMAFPGLAGIVVPIYFAPILVFEVALGVWLLVRGISPPVRTVERIRP